MDKLRQNLEDLKKQSVKIEEDLVEMEEAVVEKAKLNVEEIAALEMEGEKLECAQDEEEMVRDGLLKKLEDLKESERELCDEIAEFIKQQHVLDGKRGQLQIEIGELNHTLDRTQREHDMQQGALDTMEARLASARELCDKRMEQFDTLIQNRIHGKKAACDRLTFNIQHNKDLARSYKVRVIRVRVMRWSK